MRPASLPFAEVFRDATSGNLKTKTSEYLEAGDVPVVDQGQGLIAGYVNDRERVCRVSPPVIVFGDHTKVFKYVDFEFAIGADGTKVLVSRVEAHLRYLYWALRRIRLPEVGYSRHFKFLKECEIPLPPLPEQKRIAAILDAGDALRAKRRESLDHLDALVQSVFLDMFGDPVTNPKGWDVAALADGIIADMRNGLSPSTTGTVPGEVLTLSSITAGTFDLSERREALFDREPHASQMVGPDTFLVCRGNGNKALVGVGCFPDRDAPTVCFPDTMIGVLVDGEVVVPEYLAVVWASAAVRRQIERGARTTNGTHKVNQGVLKSIELPVPPLPDQQRFQVIVTQIRTQRRAVESHLAELDTLFASLQSRAFRGEL